MDVFTTKPKLWQVAIIIRATQLDKIANQRLIRETHVVFLIGKNTIQFSSHIIVKKEN